MEETSCYKELYYHLFSRISDICGELQALQQECEEQFLATTEDLSAETP